MIVRRRARKNRFRPYVNEDCTELMKCQFKWIDDKGLVEIRCQDVPGFDGGRSMYDYRIEVFPGEAVTQAIVGVTALDSNQSESNRSTGQNNLDIS